MFLKDGKAFESKLPTIYFGRNRALSYVLNPKAACTLALHFLFYANNNYRYFDVSHIHFSTVALQRLAAPELDPRALRNFFHISPESFSIVRDPLRRFVSSFSEKILVGGDPGFLAFRDVLTSVHGVDLSPEADPAKSCLAFAKWVASRADQESMDPHFRPQHLNLAIGGGFAIGTILRLEDRDSLLAFFSKWIGPEKAQWFLTLRFNVQKYSIDDFVSDELKDVLRGIYAQDYKLFYQDALSAPAQVGR
jgi:Sulfotransferase family